MVTASPNGLSVSKSITVTEPLAGAFVQIEVRAAEPVTEAKQCVAMRNLQHIVAVLEIRVVGDKTERTFDARPIFLIGFRVVEGIGFLEKITRGPPTRTSRRFGCRF